MALHLVPYNNAMRLGQGFNSFTQEICLDNAVVGVSDEEDTQPIIPVGFTIATPQGTGNGTVEVSNKASLDQFMANLQSKTRLHNPSQIVTYSSKFVDKLSDVADEMNVSGSLSIRYGEISGGGGGSYINAHTFQSSDVNFLITVKVLNQTINTKDQLMFWPLEKEDASTMKADRFTKVYGDSFISGFQEGGIFTALVSIRTMDDSDKLTIKANAHLALQVGVGEVKADADFAMAKSKLDKSTEINITVNWSGGGQLKEGSEKWSVETLQDVAVRFPDLVAACPQRTHAILTKYTALRSYLNWVRGKELRPLDYEIATLYTSELLDVYMGYKTIWKDIHVMLQQLDAGTIELVKAPEPSKPLFMPPKEEVEIKKDDNGNITRTSKFIKPTDKDRLNCFAPDYVDLDLALRKCRELMVRIVTENDRITDEPKLAVDSDRETIYIRPQVFRSLLPVQPPQPRLTFGLCNWSFSLGGREDTWWNAFGDPMVPQIVTGVTKFELERTGSISFDVTNDKDKGTYGYKISATTPSQKNLNHRTEITTFATPVNDEGLFVGRYDFTEPSPASSDTPKNIIRRQKVKFPYSYDSKPPTILVFLTRLQMGAKGPSNISVKASSVTLDDFEIVARGLDTLSNVAACWIACPPEVRGLQGGNTETSWAPGISEEAPKSDLKTYPSVTGHIRFVPKSFNRTPIILAWISGFSVSAGSDDIYLDLKVTEKTKRGFNWVVYGTGANAYLTGASISWLAYEDPQ